MKKMYLIATIVAVFVLGLYVPRFVTYAQDKVEQRQINKQILDLQLELEDTQMEWNIMDSDKKDFQGQIELLQQYIQDIEQEQERLHNSADDLRKQIDYLKGNYDVNDEVVNCYQYEGAEYNKCLDSVIKMGLSQRRQPQ